MQDRSGSWTNLFGSNRSLICLSQFLYHTRLASKIFLAADKENGETRAEMGDFRDPLFTATKNDYGNNGEDRVSEVRLSRCIVGAING